MEWKKLIKLLYPPLSVIALLVPICTIALVYTFIGGYEAHPVSFISSNAFLKNSLTLLILLLLIYYFFAEFKNSVSVFFFS